MIWAAAFGPGRCVGAVLLSWSCLACQTGAPGPASGKGADPASPLASPPSPAETTAAGGAPPDGVERVDPAEMGDGLRVVLLGTGTPVPQPERSGPALAVVAAGHAYLVDFGPGVVRRAVEAARAGVAALDPTRLDFALATHLHSDHTAGLSDLLLTPAVVGRDRPLTLLGPAGTVAMAEHIAQAYAVDLSIRGHDRTPAQMRGYRAQARDVEAGVVHTAGALRITAFDVPHGRFEHAFGYRFDDRTRRIVVSGDTGPSDAVVDACDGCDVLVHEVYCRAGYERGPSHFQRYHSSFHTSAPELGKLAARARPRLLVLHHLLLFGCSEQALLAEVRAHFDGPVAVGHDLDVF